MSTESELSTEDLARSGEVRQDEPRTDDVRREQAPAASEMPPDRPPDDPDSASAEGGPRQGMPQGAAPGYGEEAGAAGAREGAGATAAERSGGTGPVPDSLGGGAGDQGSMMQPGDPAGAGSAGPSSEPGAAAGGASATTDAGDRPSTADRTDGARAGEVALLGSADEERFRQRWGDAQARFVDDPQEAVRSADGLVAELMQSLAQGFSEHKARLESQWQRGGDPDTEELRQALQRYRSFFDRLLST
jgi:hypothetical protein